MLRQQNTFWKKYLSVVGIPAQPITIKNKFNAGDLKKKLFGGVASFMSNANVGAATSSVANNQNQVLM
jgi:hypothetical protein